MDLNLTFKYYRKLHGKTVYVVMHGQTNQIESPFMANVIDALEKTGQSVFGFNFPYRERGDDETSGPDLPEEVESLDKVIQFLSGEGYERIIIVGKSLGTVVASYWLSQNQDVELVALGYVLGSVKTANLKGKLRLVIQGEYDQFGNAAAIKEELTRHGIQAKVAEIKGGDHGYRNKNREPEYQAQALNLLVEDLSK